MPISPKKPPRIPPTTGATRLDPEVWPEPDVALLVVSERTIDVGGKVEVIVVRTNTTEPSARVLESDDTMTDGAGVTSVVNTSVPELPETVESGDKVGVTVVVDSMSDSETDVDDDVVGTPPSAGCTLEHGPKSVAVGENCVNS